MDEEQIDLELINNNKNTIPVYVNMERKDREAYLSQIGNFSTEEREIFNLLCDNWEDEIGYAKFVTKINKKHPIDEKFLHSLMKKLRSSGSGILLTKYVRGERGVDKLILTDIKNRFFFFYFINNEYQKNYEDVSRDFVNDSNFEKYEINTSDLSPLILKISEINKTFIKNEVGSKNIYIIKLDENNSFYATSESLQDLIKISIRKIKFYFKSDNFIALIAKIMNSSISKVRTILDHFEINDWKVLSTEILKNKKIINGKFKNISISFYKSVLILQKYCVNELEQKDKELEDEKKLKEKLKLISNTIREKEFTPYSQESFNSLFEEFGKDAIDIKSKFYEFYVDNKSKTGLTEIVFVGQYYIHQDNLYKVFLDKLALVSTEFSEFLINEYRRCLFSNSADSSLLEGFPLESTLEVKLKDESPILYDLFKRKSLLAEAIIHFCKKRNHSQGKMHSMLSTYFNEGSNDLKSYCLIFNIDPIYLFEKAYNSLSGFRRFFILITGQYSKYVERFTGRKKIKKNKPNKSGNSSSRSTYARNFSDPYIMDYPIRKSSLIKDEQPKKKKLYNKDEIDNAWNSLGNEIIKKK
ncbi:MAG: hypothetical protein JXR64_06595 [Spirochaetales bacterium]|nr:hypothetical protein [Spirochaetales bacterium]